MQKWNNHNNLRQISKLVSETVPEPEDCRDWMEGVVKLEGKKQLRRHKTKRLPPKNQPAAPKTESKPVPKKSAPAPAATAALAPVNGADDETVAVISAAVAMMYEGTGKIPVIRSGKPAATGVRSAWKTAGVLNNTRPF